MKLDFSMTQNKGKWFDSVPFGQSNTQLFDHILKRSRIGIHDSVITVFPATAEEKYRDNLNPVQAAPRQYLLVRTGWETLADKAQMGQEGYDFGWDFVLANYIITAKDK